MKIYKWIIIGSALVGIVGLLAMLVSPNQMIENVGISLFAGAIVSTVTSLLYYLYERQNILEIVRTMLPEVYVNLSVIKTITGDILQKIPSTPKLSSLNYNLLTLLAEQNVASISGYHADVFFGFLPDGETIRNVKRVDKYIPELRNLKYCLTKLQIFALDYDRMGYELSVKQMNRQTILEDEYVLYNGKRDLVEVQTAKVHEYEASLLKSLGEIAVNWFNRKKGNWTQIKAALQENVTMILKEVSK